MKTILTIISSLVIILVLVLAYISIPTVIDIPFLITKMRGQSYEKLLIEQINLYNAG